MKRKKTEKISVRETALQQLCRVEADAAYSGRMLHGEHAAGTLDERDRALLSQIVKGTLQWRGKIDAALENYLKKGIASLPLKIRNILRLGAYQVMFLDRIPAEVAVSESVKLAKAQRERDLAGLVNAVLRNLVRNLPAIRDTLAAKGSAEEIAISGSHPLWMVQRWIEQIGIDETRALCDANNRLWPLQFRVNTLKITGEELLLRLEEEGVKASPARFCADCVTVESLPREVKLPELTAFREGLFQVQDESSALVSVLLAPLPGETIVDLCCAPGGKTTHIAALMKNQGRIVALDPKSRRLNLVKSSCERLGISIVECFEGDGRSFKPDFSADRVLVDAPCSGLGVLGRKSDARWNKSPEIIKELAELQSELLLNAAGMLKTGGTLVYSTCSTDFEENERVIEMFLAASGNFRLEQPDPGFPAAALLTDRGFYRSWPQRDNLGGAFAAVMTRIG